MYFILKDDIPCLFFTNNVPNLLLQTRAASIEK